MTTPDETLSRIGAVLEVSQRSEREAARAAFAELWAQVGPDGDALHRCAIAHSMADVQDDPRDELAWDRRALEAAILLTDEQTAAAGMPGPAAAMLPSLHLNLAEDYRKLGDVDSARRHVGLGQAATPALADDGYGRMIRRGLARLDEHLNGSAG